MDHSLTCSVIIPTYNRARLLDWTLHALTRQDLPADRFEVVVVDDGSSDGTAAVVERYRDRLAVTYDYQEDQGYRLAAARNVGIAHATADICVFIDSGVLAHSRCLSAHLDSHASAPGPTAVVGYVYGFNLDNEDAELIERRVDVTDPDASIVRLAEDGRLDLREEFYVRHDDRIGDLPAPWTVYWNCNASARTAQLRSVGAFDEAFRTWGGEDIDLAYRLHRDGARFVVNRQASSIHYPHEKKADDNIASCALNYRYIADKYGTPLTRLLLPLPTINPFNLNDVARFLDVPSCADYLAGKA
ncbi:glycosyltransferase [Nonomuraea sp. B10E15]|uniref:glycosyltransferase n=1 Tax=Nonomuraea sp. B10E15 TaxID=3153560 RepID=UPI00325C98B6